MAIDQEYHGAGYKILYEMVILTIKVCVFVRWCIILCFLIHRTDIMQFVPRVERLCKERLIIGQKMLFKCSKCAHLSRIREVANNNENHLHNIWTVKYPTTQATVHTLHHPNNCGKDERLLLLFAI